MEDSESLLSRSCQSTDIQVELLKQLDKLRQQNPERFPKPVHVLAAADDTAHSQIEERLYQASKQCTEKCIVLIPYNSENFHWIGILIEFDREEQIERSEFIDPVKGSDSVPEKLQKLFTEVFPKHILHSRTHLKHEDQAKSMLLTIANLLSAVQRPEFVHANIHDNEEQRNRQKDQYSSSTYSSNSHNEGNQSELQELAEKTNVMRSSVYVSDNSDELELPQLEAKLVANLAKLNISDVTMLSDRILRSENRLKEYQEEGRSEDVEKELKYLSEWKVLQKLAEDVHVRKSGDANGEASTRLKLSQLEQSLRDTLAKLKIQDTAKLSDRILRSEQRIKEYREEGRVEEADQEQKVLIEYKGLKELAEEIRKMKFEVTRARLRELEQKLASDLVKLKIADVNVLPEKILRSEQRIREYEEEGRTEEAQNELNYLGELNKLRTLIDEIATFKTTASNTPTNSVSTLRELEEKLVSYLAKFRISDVKLLPEKILRSEQRIKEYEEEDRTEEAEKEQIYLSELNKLKTLLEEISTVKPNASSISNNNPSNLNELEEKLSSSLTKLKIRDITKVSARIKRLKEEIREYEDEDNTDDAEKGKINLNELKELQNLWEKICSLKFVTSVPVSLTPEPPAPEPVRPSPKLLHLDDLRGDLAAMPCCAEKSTMELLVHFEQRLLKGETCSREDGSVVPLLEKLQDQIKKQEWLSEKVRGNLQDLNRYVDSHDIRSTVQSLEKLLKNIRPLHIREIQRLVEKAKKAGQLISGKEIVLLVGETGTGKSTTIQFLAGSKMKKIRLEVGPGSFLEHITLDGSIINPALKHVTSSALSKSETRYIAPVTIPLRDIFGPHEYGEIILCDAPGFGDTAGPEVDIANGVGVVEAIKECESVKILALSSYKSLGDRGNGIQKLTHLLINMVQGIHQRLDAILYVFTKYPPNTDVSALLIDIKNSKVDTDPLLRSDSAFVTVLTDMISKTKQGAEIIDPLQGDPKKVIQKLKNLQGIMYPREVFRFSISEETQACILNQTQRDNSGVRCALKHQDIDLVMYYLDQLKILKDLLEHSPARDAYEDAIRFISESITTYCIEVTKKFNRALASQDGLENEDIIEYKSSIEYIQKLQKLTKHLGSNLLSPESLIQNIHSELQKRSQTLMEEGFDSPLIGIYFDNLLLLKNSFEKLESFYSEICRKFQQRFEKLVQSTSELISDSDFNKIADIILKISKCLPTLDKHLHGLVEKNYKNIVQSLLEHLNDLSEKATSPLAKIRLNENDVEIVKDCVKILRSAKENSALQDRISIYIEMLTNRNDRSVENIKGSSEVYNTLIEKIVYYFNLISKKISEPSQLSGDYALEDAETLINDMDAIRKIPEIESKTAGTYYRIVESIRGYMHQLQREVEQHLVQIDTHSGTPNYGRIVKLLSRLKNAKWTNRISPGVHDVMINRVTDELIQYFHELEDSLMKLDLSLKYPENVCKAEEIFVQIESLSVLERSVPELRKSKDEMNQRFLQSVQGNFDRIRAKFNLQDRYVCEMKQKSEELEQIQHECENLHPTRVFLRENNISDINQLNKKIDDLEKKQTELNSSQCTIPENDDPSSSKADQQGIIQESQTKDSSTLALLKSIKTQYEHLIAARTGLSSEQLNFLQSHGQNSIESLKKTIDKEQKDIAERQKKKPLYDFGDRFDASTADLALLYTINCEKIVNHRLKEIATDTHEIVSKYISEYGLFLDQEIERSFKNLTRINSQEDLFQDAQNLETRLEQLSSLCKFQQVFECIHGAEKIEQWRRKFTKQHQTMSDAMGDYKVCGKNEELREQVNIAFGLMGADYFCGDTFLSKGFGVLYRQYQVQAINQLKAAYKEVLDKILEEDFAATDNALIDVDEKKLTAKDINQIKQTLRTSLNGLIKKTRMSANNLSFQIDSKEKNENLTREIHGNIEKIRTVVSKPRIIEFLDEKTIPDLRGFEEDIKKSLAAMLLDELTSVGRYMDADDILEAEQSMENLLALQRELTNHFTLENITEQLSNVRKRLDSLASDIAKRDNFQSIEQYPIHSPKDLLSKLKRAAAFRSVKYDKVYKTLSVAIRSHFEMAIKAACEAPIEKRSALISTLYQTLQFLPEDSETLFRTQIVQLKDKFAEEEQRYKRDLKGFLENENVDDETIKKIGKLAVEYEQQTRDESLAILRSGVVKRLDEHWKNVQSAADQEDGQSVTKNMRVMIKYREYAPTISEVERYHKLVCNLASTSITKYTDTLSNIFKIEKMGTVELAFNNLVIYIEFCQEFSNRISELIPEKVSQNVQIKLKKICDDWQQISDTFQISLSDLNSKTLRRVMQVTERWNGFLETVRTCSCEHQFIQSFVKAMQNIILYSEMIFELKKKASDLEKQFNVKLISDDTTRFEKIRDKFFNDISRSFKALKSIASEFHDILSSIVDIEKVERELKEKVEDIKQKLLTHASKDELSLLEADDFRTCYNHLASFDKYIRLPQVQISHTLELVETKIFEKTMSLAKEINNAGTNFTKVGELLIKMKFFAENFSMFDSKINAVIDEVLKSYKAQGSAILGQLTMVLEKSDVGSRLIAEHSSLSGEDWRKRREKMQKQDDIEFVIKDLEGDNIDADKLRARYKTFRRIYDELVSSILTSFDPKTQTEPNIEVLISRTKILVDTAARNEHQIVWDQSFRDKLPELLAHIFAVWTLKNTQHYNTMRGIEAAQAYLLMPHVAQVIAVFRILSIGYAKTATVRGHEVPLSKRISNELVNNLVQIGTGEGKSVVMAVTACVFALIGVNVSCSCYSEYLSTRDKNDFASVFRALGIEDHIEYGTFNKLCENFLNEQCTVRERVRDMIMRNKNVIDVVETTTRIRAKVLLIDEVDVFLSEKFYGGMYTPSVYLKDPYIKALLDALWRNRDLGTLNSIQALPEYKNCATRFSNWILLLDEAVKDMLAALQLYQTSTHYVENDKIVYVEGESFSENVVRGYDTIWAYYYENQRGFISPTSLETNVGIIINCGTFSYAQMPIEFAYIAGVSGTLKTLAQPEKNILHDAYHISKNTYMPSVFGKSNRNYNPANDVAAVSKSEYFMRIRGEIDMMCNARRAILVFFECEENLLAFYNSPELSSIKETVQLITEKVSVKDRELCIKRAATEGRVTLLTRTFGRGTDFICRNPQLLANGGIHVLQTFFAEELSEEYQIMGRGARQGDHGSYRMVLLENDLEWVLGVDWEQIIREVAGSTLYAALNDARNQLYVTKCASKKIGVKQRTREHQASRFFMDALIQGEMKPVKTFLIEQNRGPNIAIATSRTLLLMDATSSMSQLLSATKDTVSTMFERTSNILKEKGLPTDVFQMQFVVYRDYDCKEGLLQSSSWETKPINLRSFIEKIEAKGGGDYEEAIEIGLWYAVEQSKLSDGISQVILIGDAPAKDRAAIDRDRKASGGESYWSGTKFSKKTFYQDEVKQLKDKKIPVHAFYLHVGAQKHFQYIAKETGGRCEALNIHSSVGAELLTTFVTEEVLRKTAGDKGEAAVELYRKTYVKKTFTS